MQNDYRRTPNQTSVVPPSCVNVHSEKVIIPRFAEISLQDSSNHQYALVPHVMHDQGVATVLILVPPCRHEKHSVSNCM